MITQLTSKLHEALRSVLPIFLIVAAAAFTIAPVRTDVMLSYCIGAVMLVVGLVGLVVTLATPYHDVFVMLVSLIFAVTGSTATRNWPNIQAWALMGTNIGESQTDVHRHVVVTSDEVVVEGPGAEVARYPLLQLKRARHDENGCLASFGRGRVAYFPARVMSASKLRELVQMFEGTC